MTDAQAKKKLIADDGQLEYWAQFVPKDTVPAILHAIRAIDDRARMLAVISKYRSAVDIMDNCESLSEQIAQVRRMLADFDEAMIGSKL